MARIKVKLNSTGEEGTVLQEEFDPQIYTLLEPQKKERSLLANVLPILGGLGGFAVGGPIGGIAGAGLGEGIAQNTSGEDLNLGKIGINAAMGGVPFGRGAGILSKVLLPGAGVGALGALTQDNPTAQSVLTGAGIGAAGAGVLSKVLPGVGKLLGKAGAISEGAGENLALKSLRLNKTQLTNYLKLHREGMATTIQRNNIVGKSAEEIQNQAIKPFQDQFNSIAKTSGIKVNRTDLDNKALSYIDELLKSPSKEDHKLAESLLEDYDFAVKSFGGDSIDISKLNSARKTFDGKVKSWFTDPIASGKNRLLGKIFREATQEAADNAGLTGQAGQSLKTLGLELNKLYDIKTLAELQGNLGKGNLPIGLTTLLSLGGGGAVGGIPGAAAAAVTTKVLNSPKAIAAYSKLATRAGGTLNKAGLKVEGVAENPLIQHLTGQAGSRLSLGQGSPGNQDSNYNTANDTINNIQDTSIVPQQERTVQIQGQTVTESQLQQAYIDDLSRGGKNKTLFEGIIKAAFGEDKGAGKAKIQNANEVVDKMEETYGLGTKDSLSQGKNTIGIQGILSRAKRETQLQTDQDFADRLNAFNQFRTFAVGPINQARGAGVLNEGEYQTMVKNIPNEYSSEKAAEKWFANMRDILKRLNASGVSSSEPSTATQ